MAAADRINTLARRLPSWPIYAVAALYALWRFWLALNGALGPDPVDALTAESGILGLQLLLLGLAITPLRRHAGINLLRFRRAIGLVAFFFVLLHFAVWLLLDLALRWDQIWSDLSKRPFIMIGMAALLVLLPLALTSSNAAIRRMGARAWQRLHRLTYLAVLLGALHYLIGVKVISAGPALYAATAVALLALRLRLPARRRSADQPAIRP